MIGYEVQQQVVAMQVHVLAKLITMLSQTIISSQRSSSVGSVSGGPLPVWKLAITWLLVIRALVRDATGCLSFSPTPTTTLTIERSAFPKLALFFLVFRNQFVITHAVVSLSVHPRKKQLHAGEETASFQVLPYASYPFSGKHLVT